METLSWFHAGRTTSSQKRSRQHPYSSRRLRRKLERWRVTIPNNVTGIQSLTCQWYLLFCRHRFCPLRQCGDSCVCFTLYCCFQCIGLDIVYLKCRDGLHKNLQHCTRLLVVVLLRWLYLTMLLSWKANIGLITGRQCQFARSLRKPLTEAKWQGGALKAAIVHLMKLLDAAHCNFDACTGMICVPSTTGPSIP